MRYFFFFLSLFFFHFSNAQTLADALRYTEVDYGGSTARSLGVGGSMGALGADYSVISSNPAGLAMYRKSEFVISPVFHNTTTNSLLLSGNSNISNEVTENKFQLMNIGMVIHSRPRNGKWTTFNVAIGFNRIAQFYQEFSFNGASVGSITDRWLEMANSATGLDNFESGPAFDAGAIYDGTDGLISDFLFFPDVPVMKSQTVTTSGSINELLLAFAGNYDEKLMWGLTLGIPFLRYEEDKVYREEDDATDVVPFFNTLEFREDLITSGAGINLKIGLNYRLSQMLRIGAAFHTPTVLGLNDIFTTQLDYNYVDFNTNQNTLGQGVSPEGNFDYRLRTPMRALGNVGFIIRKLGFVSAELEWIDYSNISFNLTTTSNDPTDVAYQETLNAEIENSLQSVVKFRLGGELAYKAMRFRAGLGIQTSPIADETTTTNTYSLGLGLRLQKVYFDLGYRLATNTSTYAPYLTSLAPQQSIENDLNINQFMLTFGYRF